MVISIGILMIGGYFGSLVALAHIAETYFPAMGPVVFVSIAVIAALALMRLQTELERFFINRHVLKHPKSRWNVVVSKGQFDLRDNN